MSKPIRLAVWADPGQEALVQDAVEHGRFELIAAAAPGTGSIRDLLRRDVDLVWLAAPAPIGADERRLLREAGVPAISSVPVPGSVAEIADDSREAEAARFAPLMRRSPGYRAAREVFDQFGRRQCASIVTGSAAGEGTLFARLFDAMDLAESLCGTVKEVGAALWRPVAGVPETLAGLAGHLTANVRFADDRCAAVAASDLAGRWFRQVTVLGEGGRLSIDDAGFEWVSPDGRLIDSHREKSPLGHGDLVAIHARRLLEGADAADPHPEGAHLLAVCEATRLSARTGAAEAP
ncbi:MAG: Gfo/Idh/MocA family oxidoreductase, partial [Planctomycetota bacterium]